MAVARKFRHPYDAPLYKQMWGAEKYKAQRAFYVVNLLKERDPKFNTQVSEISRLVAVGKLQEEKGDKLICAEIDKSLKRISNPQ